MNKKTKKESKNMSSESLTYSYDILKRNSRFYREQVSETFNIDLRSKFNFSFSDKLKSLAILWRFIKDKSINVTGRSNHTDIVFLLDTPEMNLYPVTFFDLTVYLKQFVADNSQLKVIITTRDFCSIFVAEQSEIFLFLRRGKDSTLKLVGATALFPNHSKSETFVELVNAQKSIDRSIFGPLCGSSLFADLYVKKALNQSQTGGKVENMFDIEYAMPEFLASFKSDDFAKFVVITGEKVSGKTFVLKRIATILTNQENANWEKQDLKWATLFFPKIKESITRISAKESINKLIQFLKKQQQDDSFQDEISHLIDSLTDYKMDETLQNLKIANISSENNSRHIFLLDEPDACIFPSEIYKLMRTLKEVVVKRSACRIVMTMRKPATVHFGEEVLFLDKDTFENKSSFIPNVPVNLISVMLSSMKKYNQKKISVSKNLESFSDLPNFAVISEYNDDSRSLSSVSSFFELIYSRQVDLGVKPIQVSFEFSNDLTLLVNSIDYKTGQQTSIHSETRTNSLTEFKLDNEFLEDHLINYYNIELQNSAHYKFISVFRNEQDNTLYLTPKLNSSQKVNDEDLTSDEKLRLLIFLCKMKKYKNVLFILEMCELERVIDSLVVLKELAVQEFQFRVLVHLTNQFSESLVDEADLFSLSRDDDGNFEFSSPCQPTNRISRDFPSKKELFG